MANDIDTDALLAEQVEYYRARADEYDQWWQRAGRYDRGPAATALWRCEVAEVEAALHRLAPTGSILELACGTGWWTRHLAERASSLTCVDASPEVIAVNRKRLAEAGLPTPAYVEADLFAWTPSRRYDVVFFSFWLSHVPTERFASFWRMVASALKPGGQVFFIDSLPDATSTANNHAPPDAASIVQQRKLDDGRTFQVVKLYPDPIALGAELRSLGWSVEVRCTQTYFLYGRATLA